MSHQSSKSGSQRRRSVSSSNSSSSSSSGGGGGGGGGSQFPECLRETQPFYAEGTLALVDDDPNKLQIKSELLLPNQRNLRVRVDLVANVQELNVAAENLPISNSSAIDVSQPDISLAPLPGRSRSQSPEKHLENTGSPSKQRSSTKSPAELVSASTPPSSSVSPLSSSSQKSKSRGRSFGTKPTSSTPEQLRQTESSPASAASSSAPASVAKATPASSLFGRHVTWVGKQDTIRRKLEFSSESSSASPTAVVNISSSNEPIGTGRTFPYDQRSPGLPSSNSPAPPESSATAVSSLASSPASISRISSTTDSGTQTDISERGRRLGDAIKAGRVMVKRGSHRERSKSMETSKLEERSKSKERKPNGGSTKWKESDKGRSTSKESRRGRSETKERRRSKQRQRRRSMAEKCGLIFPPVRVGRQLKEGGFTGKISRTKAKIMLAAVLETLTFDLLYIAGKRAKDSRRKRIQPVHITEAVIEDEEFYRLFRNVDFPINPPNN